MRTRTLRLLEAAVLYENKRPSQRRYRFFKTAILKICLSQVEEGVRSLRLQSGRLFQPLLGLGQLVLVQIDYAEEIVAKVVIGSDGELGHRLLTGFSILLRLLRKVNQCQSGVHPRKFW